MDCEDVPEPHFEPCQTKPVHHHDHHLQTLPVSNSGNQLELEECKIRVVQNRSMQNKPVALWTEDEVCKWIRSQYPSQSSIFVEAISEHAISGRALLRLTAGKLEQMGIAQESHRQSLLKEILQLRIQDDVESLSAAFAGHLHYCLWCRVKY
ncbi:sterile alpha motif domain-containing protein 12-like isoform X2 [Carcharodon carcharias]|uniref:sterile alpha motif domain-containing protein 12-like isoform X2 n=1 Tax=Carcharodon carcharias TaxID=13397 RepID=UPI001B7EB62F|nr:sterile alpha motif domain-containing protein 12-like isoform X2 [Carcharodon carcharias]